MEEPLDTFEALRRIVARLRSPDGCPWDRKQTHHSLKPYLIEEAYEVVESLERGDVQKLCEELGDLLLIIALQVQIAEEQGDFTMSDVLRRINEKLIRRHPHVFGGGKVNGVVDVINNWEEIKRAEGKSERSLLDGIPRDIPALAYSQIVQQRAARVGFDWKTVDGVLEKVSEELEEIRRARTHEEKVQEFGDLLFALANVARWMDIDLEGALRQSNARFFRRFGHMEQQSRQKGINLTDLSIEELDALWEEAKKAEE